MTKRVEIKLEDFKISPFELIGKEWMLIAAGKDGKTNAMTASWGGFGYMWDKSVAFMVIRPQRYTKEFVDNAQTFSLNFFDNSRRGDLNYFGTVSGRTEDKIAKSGLTVENSDTTPYFGEAKTVVICRKLYAQPFRGEFFIGENLEKHWYPDHDFHTLYVGEVLRILGKA